MESAPIIWTNDWDAALSRAREQDKLVFIDVEKEQ